MFNLRKTVPERGAAAVEFALVVLPLMLLLLGIVEFGWIFNQQVSLSNAARESARYYAVHEHQAFDADECDTATNWTDCSEDKGMLAAPTVKSASWSALGAGITLLQGCDSSKTNYDLAIGESVTATATIPMPSLTGFFDDILGDTLTGKGSTICGG